MNIQAVNKNRRIKKWFTAQPEAFNFWVGIFLCSDPLSSNKIGGK